MEYQIRPVHPRDAQGINDLRRMPGVMENTMGMPSERVQRTEAALATPDVNSHQFVAVITENGAEKVIGMVGLMVESRARQRHCGGIGLMVHTAYQGQGIGKALLETVLDVADNWLMLKRVELGVYHDNARAQALYKAHGFEVEGIKRMAVIRGGEYIDEIMMARLH